VNRAVNTPKIKLLSDYLQKNPTDLAFQLVFEPAKQAADFIKSFKPAVVAPALESVPASYLVEVFSHLKPVESIEFLKKFPTNLSAAILRGLERSLANKLVDLLGTDSSVLQIKKLLKFSENSVGFLMKPNPFTVREDTSVRELQTLLKKNPTRYGRYVYVTGDNQNLIGVVSFKDVFYSQPDTLVANLMKTKITTLYPETIASEAYKLESWKTHSMLPVTDKNTILLGVLRIERLEDFLELNPADTRSTDLTETGAALGEVLQIGINATALALGFDETVHKDKFRDA
jgi:magnesium transporter